MHWFILLFGSAFRWDYRWDLNSDWDQRSAKKWSRFSFGLSDSLNVSLRLNFGRTGWFCMYKIGYGNKFWWAKITSLFRWFIKKQRNTEISAMTSWSEQWCALWWLVNHNSGLSPKLSGLVSVFGLSERLIQKVKWPAISQALHVERRTSSEHFWNWWVWRLNFNYCTFLITRIFGRIKKLFCKCTTTWSRWTQQVSIGVASSVIIDSRVCQHKSKLSATIETWVVICIAIKGSDKQVSRFRRCVDSHYMRCYSAGSLH